VAGAAGHYCHLNNGFKTIAHKSWRHKTRLTVALKKESWARWREREAFYTGQGIGSMPAVIINDRHLISGGQPVAVFEQALRQMAAQTA